MRGVGKEFIESNPFSSGRAFQMNGRGNRHSETMEYVRSMLGQLRTMAEAERCDMAAYLIEMAYIEVSDILRGERPRNVAQSAREVHALREALAERKVA